MNGHEYDYDDMVNSELYKLQDLKAKPMITITLPACQALCDYLTKKGVKLPETELNWWVGGRLMLQNISLVKKYAKEAKFIPMPTFSELITDWLPLLFGRDALWEELGIVHDLTRRLRKVEGGMPNVSSRVIEIIKYLE